MFEHLGIAGQHPTEITWKTTIWMAIFCCVCFKKKVVTLFLVAPHAVSLLQNGCLVEDDFTTRKKTENVVFIRQSLKITVFQMGSYE